MLRVTARSGPRAIAPKIRRYFIISCCLELSLSHSPRYTPLPSDQTRSMLINLLCSKFQTDSLQCLSRIKLFGHCQRISVTSTQILFDYFFFKSSRVPIAFWTRSRQICMRLSEREPAGLEALTRSRRTVKRSDKLNDLIANRSPCSRARRSLCSSLQFLKKFGPRLQKCFFFADLSVVVENSESSGSATFGRSSLNLEPVVCGSNRRRGILRKSDFGD